MKALLKKFKNDDDGVMAIELLMVTPILVWALLSTYVYFDAFRVESVSNRTALTIADMFSREEEVDPNYLNGARSLLRTLTYEESTPSYRITVYTYDGDNDQYLRIWSRNRGGIGNYNNADLSRLKGENRLPLLADADQAILLETFVDYDAPFSIGLGPTSNLEDLTFETFVVIRPRPGRLCWDQDPLDATPALCNLP